MPHWYPPFIRFLRRQQISKVAGQPTQTQTAVSFDDRQPARYSENKSGSGCRNLEQMSKSLTIIALLLLLSGCGIGILPGGDKPETFEYPNMHVLNRKGGIYAGSYIVKNGQPVRNTSGIKDVKELTQYWGEPDERSQVDKTTERWEYRLDKFRWHGALLWILFIPVPVLIPFGYDHATLLIQEDQVVSGTNVRSGPTSAFVCGFFPLDSPGAKSMWRCGEMKPE